MANVSSNMHGKWSWLALSLLFLINQTGFSTLPKISQRFKFQIMLVGGREILQISLLFLVKLPIFLARLLVANIANIVAPGLVLGMVKKQMLKSKDLADESSTKNGSKFKWGNIESSEDVAFFMSLDL